jgi:hypothetical protein
MSSPEARARLAAQQAQLMLALTGRGQPPAACDPARLRATAEALATKRARAVARVWPGLAQGLGVRFRECFDEFAAAVPLPHEGGPLADGRAFARVLARRGQLSDAGRLEALAVDLHYRVCRGGLRPRRGPAVAWARLHESGQLVLGFRLPWLGERRLTLPLSFAMKSRSCKEITGIAGVSILAQQGVLHKAAANMGARTPAVGQDGGVTAPGLFKGIG